jgi:hypothetical protein
MLDIVVELHKKASTNAYILLGKLVCGSVVHATCKQVDSMELRNLAFWNVCHANYSRLHVERCDTLAEGG